MAIRLHILKRKLPHSCPALHMQVTLPFFSNEELVVDNYADVCMCNLVVALKNIGYFR